MFANYYIDEIHSKPFIMNYKTQLLEENFKKILVTLTDDPRVILIKLADRLHNMRTLDSMRRDKQLKIASETLYLYAPLAHRLGLYNINFINYFSKSIQKSKSCYIDNRYKGNFYRLL